MTMPVAANPHAAWRLALALPMARLYATHPKMAAVVVAGSVGSGWADRYSDVEIHTFWREGPTDDERRALAREAGAVKHELWPYEDDEWSDELHVPVPESLAAAPTGAQAEAAAEAAAAAVAGATAAATGRRTLQVGFSQFLVETIESWIEEAVGRCEVSIDHQLQIAGVLQSIPVSGHALIGRWRARAAVYPEGLRRAMALAHLPFNGRWYGVEMLAARDDALMLYEIAHDVCRQVMGVLHGLNRTYVANPHYKWLEETASGFAVAPPDLANRLRRVFRAPPAEGMETLQRLCEETLDLVERELPDVDVAPYWRRLRNRRAVFDLPVTTRSG
jgi:hypothetical protein